MIINHVSTSAFRVWDTSNWKASEKWRTNALAKNLESVKCAQWSKGSRHLLVSLQHSDVIHVIRFDKLGSSEYSFAINLHQYTRTIKDKAEDHSEISQYVHIEQVTILEWSSFAVIFPPLFWIQMVKVNACVLHLKIRPILH